MKRLITFLVCLVLFLNVKLTAQDTEEIKGRVIDENSSQPVAFANVSLHSAKDSSIIAGDVTDEKGEFTIKGIKKDQYYLMINYMGYKGKMIDKIELQGQNKGELGNIQLSPSEIVLSEANVVADKMKGQEKVDRTVYSVPSGIKSMSNSGLDVLKHIPAVNVDLQENITLEGRSDVIFYVDGIQRDKDFVSQINPASIDRVEIITNPSARYGGDISGVIEIFLIKEKAYGMSGRVSADIPSPPTYIMSPSANLDYGYSNIRLYVSDRMHFEKFNGFQETSTLRYMNNQTYKQENYGTGKFTSSNNNLNYGMDWFINEKNTLNFLGNISSYGFSYNDFQFDSKQFIDDELHSKETIEEDNNNEGTSTYYSVYYKRKFENQNQQLTMQGSFYDYTGLSNQNFENQQLDINTDELINQYSRQERVENRRNSFDYMADYSQSFDKSSIEAGIKTFYQWYNNTHPTASDVDNKFVFNELRWALYTNFSYKFEKLSLQAGLRAESSETDINNTAKNNYLCLLPQFSAIHKFSNTQSIKLNARRRIFRPGIDNLNPFRVWSDSLHVQSGNPSLEPSYSNDIELAYSKNFNSSMVSPKLYAKYITGDFQNAFSINNDGVIESVTQNIGKSWEYGLSVNFSVKLAKWWMINGYARVYNKVIFDNETNSQTEKISYQTDISSIMTFFKTWNFMMMFNYRSPYISYQQTNYRDPLFLIAIEKELFKNGKLQVLYLPPYTNRFTFQKYQTKTNELENNWKGGIDFDYLFAIQFSYSFKIGKKVKSLERKTEIDSDSNKSLF